jgi:hypothetical protein
MPARAQATLRLSKEPPLATWSADGTFQLQMLAYDFLTPCNTQPWRLLWAGQAACNWWTDHGQHLQPGTALRVEATHIRAHVATRGPEIHATVTYLTLAKSDEYIKANAKIIQAALDSINPTISSTCVHLHVPSSSQRT